MLIQENVVVEANQLDRITEAIYDSIKNFENTIYKGCFIKKILDIKHISEGKIQHSPDCDVTFTVCFECKSFDIEVGDIIDAELRNKTSMGYFCIVSECTVCNIFIPHTESILVPIGQTIKVRIIGKKITDQLLCIATTHVFTQCEE